MTDQATLDRLIADAEQELAVALLMAGCTGLTAREYRIRKDRLMAADADLAALRELVAE